MPSSHKPLGRKAYGSIGHLPNSRLGPGDHRVPDGQAKICTEKPRDKHDTIIVQEKLDGANVAVALIAGVLIPLGRAGYEACTSPFLHVQMFPGWVFANESRFRSLLQEGEWVVGEWLALAHGTRYDLNGRDPFVPFDIMHGESVRAPWEETRRRCLNAGFAIPFTPFWSNGAVSIKDAMGGLGEYGRYGAVDRIEGAVWRVEREGKVDFLAKYVRPDKVDGLYLPEISGVDSVWNWQPMETARASQ